MEETEDMPKPFRGNLNPARELRHGDQDWATKCQLCDAVPTVHPTGLCGPCCFGEADTVGGNW